MEITNASGEAKVHIGIPETPHRNVYTVYIFQAADIM
jgi:hypothetical protein